MATNIETWQELRTELGIVPAPQILSPQSAAALTTAADTLAPEQVDAIKAEIITLWKAHKNSGAAIAPLLYKLCKALHAPGKKGNGFDAWLKGAKIPHSSAYRWIVKYANREGLDLPFSTKQKQKTATLSHVAQTLPLTEQHCDELRAEYIPAPTSLSELKKLLKRSFESAGAASRHDWAKELVRWITQEILEQASETETPEL
jgi:hypothetical protein